MKIGSCHYIERWDASFDNEVALSYLIKYVLRYESSAVAKGQCAHGRIGGKWMYCWREVQ
jgi:hypothetical protein